MTGVDRQLEIPAEWRNAPIRLVEVAAPAMLRLADDLTNRRSVVAHGLADYHGCLTRDNLSDMICWECWEKAKAQPEAAAPQATPATVYVATYEPYHDNGEIVGVKSTLEAAKAAAAERCKGWAKGPLVWHEEGEGDAAHWTTDASAMVMFRIAPWKVDATG